MARIRTIKPEFFTSLTVAGLSVEARLTFIGLWTHVDDQGRCVDDPRLIKAAVWPLDDRVSADVERDLKELTESSLILRYRVGERSYLCVRAWSEHQRINRPTRSSLPPPPESPEPPPSSHSASWQPAETPDEGPGGKSPSSASVRAHAQLTDGSLAERKGKEQGTGKGKEPPYPPRRDLDPPDDTNPGESERLVVEWMNSCNRRPPRQVINDVGKLVLEMLTDGTDPEDIRRGIRMWQSRGSNPKTLPSFVNQVMNSRPTSVVVAMDDHRPSVTDQRVASALELGRRLQAEADRKALEA